MPQKYQNRGDITYHRCGSGTRHSPAEQSDEDVIQDQVDGYAGGHRHSYPPGFSVQRHKQLKHYHQHVDCGRRNGYDHVFTGKIHDARVGTQHIQQWIEEHQTERTERETGDDCRRDGQ